MGARLITATDIAELSAITSPIHDQWFRLSDVYSDEQERVVGVPFDLEDSDGIRVSRRLRFHLCRISIPTVRATLMIREVRDIVIEDIAGTDSHDFNVIEYDGARSQITLSSGIPMRFEVTVDALDVALDISDDLVRERKMLTWGRRWPE